MPSFSSTRSEAALAGSATATIAVQAQAGEAPAQDRPRRLGRVPATPCGASERVADLDVGALFQVLQARLSDEPPGLPLGDRQQAEAVLRPVRRGPAHQGGDLAPPQGPPLGADVAHDLGVAEHGEQRLEVGGGEPPQLEPPRRQRRMRRRLLGPPVGGGHLVLLPALAPVLGLAEEAHPELAQHGDRRRVLRPGDADDALEPGLFEAVLERGGAGLGGIAGAPRGRLERIGHLDGGAAVQGPQAGDADQPSAARSPTRHCAYPRRRCMSSRYAAHSPASARSAGRRAVPEAHDLGRGEHGEDVRAVSGDERPERQPAGDERERHADRIDDGRSGREPGRCGLQHGGRAGAGREDSGGRGCRAALPAAVRPLRPTAPCACR